MGRSRVLPVTGRAVREAVWKAVGIWDMRAHCHSEVTSRPRRPLLAFSGLTARSFQHFPRRHNQPDEEG